MWALNKICFSGLVLPRGRLSSYSQGIDIKSKICTADMADFDKSIRQKPLILLRFEFQSPRLGTSRALTLELDAMLELLELILPESER